MAVEIEQLEVVPATPRDAERRSPAPVTEGPQPPHPELAHEIAATIALLHSRDLRLHAD